MLNNTEETNHQTTAPAVFAEPSIALRERVEEALLARELSQREAAKQMGISQPVLSKWLQDTYAGDSDKIHAKAAAWLANSRRKKAHTDDFVETPTAGRILGVLQHAREECDMVVIYGGPGIGKTRTLQTYVAEHEGGAWIATMDPASSALVPCLQAVAKAIELTEVGGGAKTISEQIIQRLGTRHGRGVLIIDEAQHLSMASVEQLRSIHDVAEIGLALVGNEVSYTRFTGGVRAAHYAQIRSRIGFKLPLPKTTPADVQALAAAWGITDTECLDILIQVALQPGALRSVNKALRIVHKTKDPVTPVRLRKACRFIGAEV